MKKCQTCNRFPCLKVQCCIGNKEGCEDYESQAAAVMKQVKVDDPNYKFERIDE